MNWHNYYINIAKEVAKKSKDPSSQVGAVIVNENNQLVSTGFNGFIAKCDERIMTYERPLKYNLILHAEMNALIFANTDVHNCTIYSTHGPCDNCLKHILQAGIRKFYYDDPGIIRDRGTKDQKTAISRMINATRIEILNVNNKLHYVTEIYHPTSLKVETNTNEGVPESEINSYKDDKVFGNTNEKDPKDYTFF